MARVPRQVSRQVIPSGRVAGAVIPTSIADVGQGIEAQALGGLGRAIGAGADVIMELALRDRKANDLNQAATDTVDRQDSELAVEEWKNKNPLDQHTAENFAKVWDENNRFDASLYQDENARERAQLVHAAERDSFIRTSAINATDARIKNTTSATLKAYISDPIKDNRNNYLEALKLEHTGDLAEELVADADAKIIESQKKAAIENIKPALVEAIETVDKEEAIKTLDLATKQLQEDGVLSKAEGAQVNKVLGDWIDNFVAGRFKQAKDAVKLTTTEAYSDLSGKIVSGTLTFQDIDESSLLKADKDKWRIYIKGSYKDAPTETTQAGLLSATAAVFDAATLQLSPTEAADGLLKARFIDNSITNDWFNWGLDKIENPYPRQILEDLRATYNSNNEDFNRIFKADKNRNKDVNEALIAWVDDLIKRDKVPAFDFKKKMHAISSQFRVGNARWYDIGQVIQRGGRNWEVVGFDENGEPLVDEVQ